MMTVNQKNIKPGQQDDFLRIQDLLYLCLARWKWFVLSLAVTIGAATAYLLRTPAVYTRTASVLIKEDSKGKSVSSDLESFSEFGLFQSGTNVNNELITFRSPSLMTEVVKRLRLDMNYFVRGKFHRQVAYGLTLPVDVTINDLPENESAGFTLEIQPDGTLYLSDFIRNGTDLEEKDVKGSLLDSITTPLGKIIIHTTPNYVKGEAYTLYVGKSSLYNAVNSCSSNLSVSLNSEKASVIDLSFKDNSTQRAEDVLSMLISVYNENWVKDKNQIAVSTSMFINERLGVIERELGNVDEDISSYKSEHLLPDVQAASSMYMAQSSAANAQILSLNNQLYMTRYIRNYLANDANRTQLLPANSGIESANIESQIAEYNKQLLQRNSLVANSSTENPLVVDIGSGIHAWGDNQIYRQSDSDLEFADKKFAADGATDDITYSGQPNTGQVPAFGGAPTEGKGKLFTYSCCKSVKRTNSHRRSRLIIPALLPRHTAACCRHPLCIKKSLWSHSLWGCSFR